eukprot:4912040-Pleurochrysis_carterae.AAC.9
MSISSQQRERARRSRLILLTERLQLGAASSGAGGSRADATLPLLLTTHPSRTASESGTLTLPSHALLSPPQSSRGPPLNSTLENTLQHVVDGSKWANGSYSLNVHRAHCRSSCRLRCTYEYARQHSEWRVLPSNSAASTFHLPYAISIAALFSTAIPLTSAVSLTDPFTRHPVLHRAIGTLHNQ